MTHDPDHDMRAMHPGLRNGLGDRRLDEAYRAAQEGRGAEQVPWELRGTRRPASSTTSRRPRGGHSATTRVILALLLVVALVAALVGRW
ncbi:hypothetical protein MWU75_12025 [Ornithinimicrobium sp. F0845]|uniref:hypothetical protein n=1 Tax=Ornithinimicrobium sp. F0845 TaxID=2926412 RepID=UPI001FF5E822|nr:hypothetical protein [Ornithinimicrobium sp. F0845]MCK0112867.1 hypothetical protein [Ornithinimicrobium sp. F0845]